MAKMPTNMNSDDIRELIEMWRQIAKDNAENSVRFNQLADQLEAALEAGQATFAPMPKKPRVWPGAKV